MAGLDIDTLNTELKVKTCIFTCRYSSTMGRLIVDGVSPSVFRCTSTWECNEVPK